MSKIDQVKQMIESPSSRSETGLVARSAQQPTLTYADVLSAVAKAEKLTDGVAATCVGRLSSAPG